MVLWRPEEDAALLKLWPTKDWEAISNGLPGRSHWSIKSRASALGVRRRPCDVPRKGAIVYVSPIDGKKFSVSRGQRYMTTVIEGTNRLLHRVEMERILGRPLTRRDVVHHKNGDKHDNRPENLMLTTPSEHKIVDIARAERAERFIRFKGLWKEFQRVAA